MNTQLPSNFQPFNIEPITPIIGRLPGSRGPQKGVQCRPFKDGKAKRVKKGLNMSAEAWASLDELRGKLSQGDFIERLIENAKLAV